MDESELQQQVQIEGVQYGTQLMRNNSGALKDAEGRTIRFGLGNISKKHSDRIKSSDLIGFRRVLITPEMVGKVVAVITAAEIKKPGWRRNLKDKRENAQENFINWIKSNGGLAGFVSSIEEFRKLIGV